MKKSYLPFVFAGVLILSSCNLGATSSDSGSASSTSATTGGNTVSSVLSSFGHNLTVNASFDFLANGGSAPAFNATYIELGCRFGYTNFGTDKKNGGFVYVKEGKKEGVAAGTYTFTEETPNVLTLGEAVSSDYRSLYDTPSEIGADPSAYVAAFIPQIKGTTNGFFNLNYELDDNGNRINLHAHDALVASLAKSLGVYDTITSVSGVSLDYATLYFSDKGTNFTFVFYAQYGTGFNGLKTTVAVNSVGATEIQSINDYFAPSTLELSKTSLSMKVGGPAQTLDVTSDAGAIISATSSKDYVTVSVSGMVVTVTPLAAITDTNNPFADGSTRKNATITVKASDADGFYKTATCRVVLLAA
jgi:hypothetical protein